MNDLGKEISTLQTMLTYYKNRSVDIEYQFVLYKAKMEDRLKELQEALISAGRDLEEVKSEKSVRTKKNKSDGASRKTNES